jgi:hypothetical protein
MSRILDIDPISGAWETVEYDDGEDQIIYRRFQDIEPVLAQNKYLQTNAWGRQEWMWHAASIPEIFVCKWLHEDGVNVLRKENWDFLKRKLNDPDFRDFRVHQFRV